MNFSMVSSGAPCKSGHGTNDGSCKGQLRYRSLLSTVGRDVGRAGEKEQSSTLPTGARGTVPRPLVEARGGGASGVV